MKKTKERKSCYQTQTEDKEGLTWDVKIYSKLNLLDSLSKNERWLTTLEMNTTLNRESLIRTGTLVKEKNKRIIELLGSDLVHMNMLILKIKTQTEEDGLKVILNEIPICIEKLKYKPMHKIKYSHILNHIERKNRFIKKYSLHQKKYFVDDLL